MTIPSNSLPASGEHDIRIFIGGDLTCVAADPQSR